MIHDFEWFLEQLEPVKMGSEARGSRDYFTRCPVHGGSDSLHITEKNGKALIKCFNNTCNAGYREVVEALESEEVDQEHLEHQEHTTDATDATDAPVLPTVRRRRRTRDTVAPDGEQVTDPLAWYASYCGVTVEQLAQMPVRATEDGWLEHYWDGVEVTKDRKAGGSERRWSKKGATPPRLWPMVDEPPPSEVWLCEGETDAIVLRCGYGLPAFTSGSATTTLDETELSVLYNMGVDSVVVAYDNDKEGRKAQGEVVKAARAAGLMVSVAEPGHPILGGPKDWRERWTLNPDPKDIPPKGTAASSITVHELGRVEPAADESLLLGRLDASDHTILFGDGGAGKGMVAAWWVACLTKGWGTRERNVVTTRPMKVLVVDYEAHARTEWRKRIEAFGGNMARVLITQPTRPIWDVASAISEVILEHGVDYVVVDSALYACAGADAYKPEGATQYSLAIAQFKCPTLTLAHKTKTKEDQDKPFGTIFWHNGARLTISIDAEGYDTPRMLRTRKANHGESFSVEIDWSWVGSGLPNFLVEADSKIPLDDLILEALEGGPLTKKQIAETIERPVNQALSNALQDLAKTGQIVLDKTRAWSLTGNAPTTSIIPITRVKRDREGDTE